MSRASLKTDTIIKGKLYYYPKYKVYYYSHPKVYYDVRTSRYVSADQIGGVMTEEKMRKKFGPPPDHPSSNPIPYSGQVDITSLSLDDLAKDIGDRQEVQRRDNEVTKTEDRKQTWSNIKTGFSNMFKTHPCEEWREHSGWAGLEADKYKKSWAGSSLNGCCKSRSSGCPIGTDINSPCLRGGEANPEFNDACARILLAQARSNVASTMVGNSDSTSRCARVMREATSLLGTNNDWYRNNCTSQRGLPYNATISELEQSVSPTWASDDSNPLSEQDALRSELFRDSGAMVEIDNGPILDRVCQMCNEDEASFPQLGWKGHVGLEMMGVDVNEDRAALANMRRGQYNDIGL